MSFKQEGEFSVACGESLWCWFNGEYLVGDETKYGGGFLG
jgi:hypothetical protein